MPEIQDKYCMYIKSTDILVLYTKITVNKEVSVQITKMVSSNKNNKRIGTLNAYTSLCTTKFTLITCVHG